MRRWIFSVLCALALSLIPQAFLSGDEGDRQVPVDEYRTYTTKSQHQVWLYVPAGIGGGLIEYEIYDSAGLSTAMV